MVRVRPEVLQSDEAILAVFGHEMHELNSLRQLFAEGGSMTSNQLRQLIQAPSGSLHQEAVRIGDLLAESIRP